MRCKNSERAKVIVTGPHKRFKFGWWATRFMLNLVNLDPYYLTAHSTRIPQDVQGIIIGGGDDIEPEHYGLTKNEAITYDPERDRLEMGMLESALKSDIPILGICRGSQLINVVMGGSLHADIRPFRVTTPNKYSIFPTKWAKLSQTSRLRNIFNRRAVKVNSLHNQAVDRLASGLNVAARDSDGFVQATEASDKSKFVLGVQWHPEYMPYSKVQRRLFTRFSDAVRKQDKALIV